MAEFPIPSVEMAHLLVRYISTYLIKSRTMSQYKSGVSEYRDDESRNAFRSACCTRLLCTRPASRFFRNALCLFTSRRPSKHTQVDDEDDDHRAFDSIPALA